jgi:hypothetical protein
MAQIIPIVSDALQSTIRRLLPSQSGFGEDLQAQNVIVPIIDLTPSAEGSVLSTSLQESLAFGSQTSFATTNGTETLANTPGFYRVFGLFTGQTNTSTNRRGRLQLSNGLSAKVILDFQLFATNGPTDVALPFDFNVFLTTGDSLEAVSGSTKDHMGSTIRQIATSTGELVNPSGFVAE